MIFMENLGITIKNLRKEAGLTQADLAEKLHISPQTVSRWEIGEGEPSLELACSLAKVLGVSVNRLVSFNITDSELFERVSSYVAEIGEEELPKGCMALSHAILSGFHKRVFPDVPFSEQPTYTTFGKKSIFGLYANRDDTPVMFTLYDQQIEHLTSIDEWLDLTNIFSVLSDTTSLLVIDGIIKGKMEPSKVYDAESVCKLLNLDIKNFLIAAVQLEHIGILKEFDMSYDNETVRVYQALSVSNVSLLLSLAVLLFKRKIDGNL